MNWAFELDIFVDLTCFYCLMNCSYFKMLTHYGSAFSCIWKPSDEGKTSLQSFATSRENLKLRSAEPLRTMSFVLCRFQTKSSVGSITTLPTAAVFKVSSPMCLLLSILFEIYISWHFDWNLHSYNHFRLIFSLFSNFVSLQLAFRGDLLVFHVKVTQLRVSCLCCRCIQIKPPSFSSHWCCCCSWSTFFFPPLVAVKLISLEDVCLS